MKLPGVPNNLPANVGTELRQCEIKTLPVGSPTIMYEKLQRWDAKTALCCTSGAWMLQQVSLASCSIGAARCRTAASKQANKMLQLWETMVHRRLHFMCPFTAQGQHTCCGQAQHMDHPSDDGPGPPTGCPQHMAHQHRVARVSSVSTAKITAMKHSSQPVGGWPVLRQTRRS